MRSSRLSAASIALLVGLVLVGIPSRLHAEARPVDEQAAQPAQDRQLQQASTGIEDVLDLSAKLSNEATRAALLPTMEADAPFGDASTNTSTAGRRLLGQRYYRVVIQSAQGTCLAVYDGNNDSKQYSWSCNARDARQIWYWFPDSGYIMSAMGSCMAIYDGNNDSKPYGWKCLSDVRQQWRYTTSADSNRYWGMIKSRMGSCLALYQGGNNQQPYGWNCLPTDTRQWWRMITV